MAKVQGGGFRLAMNIHNHKCSECSTSRNIGSRSCVFEMLGAAYDNSYFVLREMLVYNMDEMRCEFM